MLKHSEATFSKKALRRHFPRYVPNEVVITTVPGARNDDLPHYLNVAAGMAPSVANFGDNSIDAVFQRINLSTRSISRVFVPHVTARAVSPKDGARALAHSRIMADYQEDEHRLGLDRTYRIGFGHSVENIHQVCHALRESKAIEDARPNRIAEACTRPDDEFYGDQWGLQAINCEPGWELETGHPEVLIAIVDSGIDLQHEDLEDKLSQGYDFVDYQGPRFWPYYALGDYRVRDEDPDDDNGHGTHCAGIIGAIANNGTGVCGVSWGGILLPVRVMFSAYSWLGGYTTGIGTDTDIDAGIKFAVDSGASVINLSLGGPEPSHEKVLEYAHEQKVCVICATGNENSNDPSYPASHPTTLAVGAVDQSLSRADFSNYGSAYNRFVMAPGVEIESTYKDNSYESLGGTSMATPFVSGLAGLILSYAKRAEKVLGPDEVYEIIRATARPLGTGKGDTFHGEGLVDVKAALEGTKEKCGC